MNITLWVGNTLELDVISLKDNDANAINDATIDLTIYDKTGAKVPGVTWPVVAVFIPSSSGDYRAVVTNALQITAKAQYVVEVVASSSAGVGRWAKEITAKNRPFS